MFMAQKLIQIGNSTGITIPADIRKKMDLKKDSKVYVRLNSEGDMVVSKDKNSDVSNDEVFSALKKVNKRYGSALKKLAEL